jgi:low temperature requirement protein LtrA
VTPVHAVLRPLGRSRRVTNAELFFDLIYVFAVTQLSHQLLTHHDAEGVFRTLVLLGMVWVVWTYTTWVTNWLDPDHLGVRLMLMATALGSLVLSLAIPDAFESRGWAVAGAFAGMQVLRSVFVVVALRNGPPALRVNFERILCWSVVSSGLAIFGATQEGNVRAVFWLAAVAFETLGGATGFVTPILGRSTTDDWDIDAGHFAERCQAFVLIAFGESVVVIGQTLADIPQIAGRDVFGFVLAFIGAVSLWWVYFDRSAERAEEVIAESADPGAWGRWLHFVHPIMIAGIIATAAADELFLADEHELHTTTVWLMCGGAAVFLAGHALLRYAIWRRVPWTRIIAVAALLVLIPIGAHLSLLVVGACLLVIVLAVIAADALQSRPTVHA